MELARSPAAFDSYFILCSIVLQILQRQIVQLPKVWSYCRKGTGTLFMILLNDFYKRSIFVKQYRSDSLVEFRYFNNTSLLIQVVSFD